MQVCVFVLGRPGTGKSTAACQIGRFAEEHGWLTFHEGDYSILDMMFKADVECNRFLPTIHGGFDVNDFSVLNEALAELERKVRRLTRPLDKEMLITIEFARNNYREALKSFAPDFLWNAYFLFLQTDIDTCVHRVRNRAVHSTKTNDHYVSEEIIRIYYAYDDIPQIVVDLKRDYGIEERRVRVINNVQASLKFFKDVEEFAKSILPEKYRETEQLSAVSALTSQMTEPIQALPVDR